MKEKIKEQLKAKLKAAGVNLSNKRMDAIADRLSTKITKEEEIDAKLDELNELSPFAEMAKFDDYERAKEAKEKEDKKKKDAEDAAAAAAKDKEEEKPADSAKAKDDEMPAWFKPYAEDLQSIKKEKTQTTLREKLAQQMKEKNIPMVFAKGRTLEKEEDIEALVTELEADPEVKALIEPVVTTRRPLNASGAGNGKPTDAEVDGILSKII
jgi:hypothetical protein